MDSDEEFLAERRRIDDRVFLIRACDSEQAPRIAPAVAALRRHLASGDWRTHASTLAAALRDSDLAVRTADNLIRRAVAAGLLEKRGEYMQAGRGRAASDTRAYRLIDWPDSEDAR